MNNSLQNLGFQECIFCDYFQQKYLNANDHDIN